MKLTEKDVLLLAQIENWCTYRQLNGEVLAFNSLSGRPEPLRSFNLDYIPEFDALLLFGGNPRPVKYAALIMHYFKEKFKHYPEFLTVGGAPNKGQSALKPENECYEEMMIRLGFPSEVILKNHHISNSHSTKENISEIVKLVHGSESLARLARPRIAVVTTAGYSLRAAQELGLALSDYELLFFETPATPQPESLFVSELYDGYKIDILLASAWHSMNMQSWEVERLPLSPKKMASAPNYDDIHDLVAKGYCFYMYPNMMQDLDFSEQEIYELRNQRRIEITGYNLEGEKVGEGWPNVGNIFQPDLVDKFLKIVQQEFIAKSVFISALTGTNNFIQG